MREKEKKERRGKKGDVVAAEVKGDVLARRVKGGKKGNKRREGEEMGGKRKAGREDKGGCAAAVKGRRDCVMSRESVQRMSREIFETRFLSFSLSLYPFTPHLYLSLYVSIYLCLSQHSLRSA